MFDAKSVADLITASRGVLGLVVAWLGLTQREEALPVVALLMLLDWTGDFVDGGIAHRSRQPRRTRIGDSDLYIDLFVSLCLAIYLIGSGFAGLWAGFWYFLAWALILMRFGLDRNLLMLLQAPIYLWFILIAVRLVPAVGNWLIIWVLIALALNWRRFSRDIVPKFIRGVRDLLDARGKPGNS